MKVDAIATYSHYADHIFPIWEALPDEIRGDVYLNQGLAYPGALPLREAKKSTNLALCAGISDTRRSRGAPILCEHGVGQSYGDSPSASRSSAYAGGDGRGNVVLFLHPNEYSADRDRAKYPRARVEVIGSPYLETLKTIVHADNPKPVVAISGHWPAGLCNETLSAWGEYHTAFVELAQDDGFTVIGHGHPRIIKSLAPHYARMGVDVVTSFKEVVARADVFVCDNSSAQFLSAACGVAQVVLDSKWYDPMAEHQLRFWDCADIGPRIRELESLPAAVVSALTRRPWPGADEILGRVFPDVGDPVQVAVAAIVETVAANTPMPSRR